jgi:hypothetical protein
MNWINTLSATAFGALVIVATPISQADVILLGIFFPLHLILL